VVKHHDFPKEPTIADPLTTTTRLTPTIPQQSAREVHEFEFSVLVADYGLLAITILGGIRLLFFLLLQLLHREYELDVVTLDAEQ
jgi:hypothetical protein